jgi:hypothetical protein
MKKADRKIILALLQIVVLSSLTFGGSSYKGYSGAPGRQLCASSCHGNTGGTITVKGIPATYQPGQIYRIVIGHTGSTKIRNYNASTRIGSSTTVAGSFSALTNAVSYSVTAESGMCSPVNDIDSSVFNWTAPSTGTGTVNFYFAGYQGTSMSSGTSTVITAVSTEATTSISEEHRIAREYSMAQNYPNPFNPTTTIEYYLAKAGRVTLTVFDVTGKTIAVLTKGDHSAGKHSVIFDAKSVTSGMYYYRLETAGTSLTRKLMVIK